MPRYNANDHAAEDLFPERHTDRPASNDSTLPHVFINIRRRISAPTEATRLKVGRRSCA